MSEQTAAESALAELPVKGCETRFCANRGRFTDWRIIWVGTPLDEFIGWCATCRKRVCTYCARHEELSQETFWALSDDDEIKSICLRLGVLPVTLCCRHCGEYLGEGEQMLTLVNPSAD